LKERLKRLLGEKYRRFVRKIGLNTILRLTGRQRDQFMQHVSSLVDFQREVAIKSQCFAMYYILQLLNANEEIPPILFSQYFFYACMQLVLGRSITNSNRKLPR